MHTVVGRREKGHQQHDASTYVSSHEAFRLFNRAVCDGVQEALSLWYAMIFEIL